MHNWTILVLAVGLFAWGVFSRRLENGVVTPAMFFVAFGLLFGPEGTGWITVDVGGEELRGVAELTLTLVLFTDASRLNLRALRQDFPLPARLLGVGLPLTIGLGTLAAKALFGGLTWLEAGLVGVILAPTDAALGQAVVSDPRLPVRVSQGLNVESGLNDGICVPLLLILLAATSADEGVINAAAALRLIFEQIGYGLMAGVGAATVGSVVMAWASRRGFMSSQWRRVATLATAAACYGLAVPLGGSGFIAAFAGGLVFGWLNHKEVPALTELVVDGGELFAASDVRPVRSGGGRPATAPCRRRGGHLRGPQLDGSPDAPGHRRSARHPCPASHRRVHRMVRSPRPGVDRIRRDRSRRAGAVRGLADHRDRLGDRAVQRVPSRPDSRAVGRPLRQMV